MNKKKISITSVRYRTSIEVAPFRHKHLEAEATVPPGTDPAIVAAELAVWVNEQLGISMKAARRGSLRQIGDE